MTALEGSEQFLQRHLLTKDALVLNGLITILLREKTVFRGPDIDGTEGEKESKLIFCL